MRYIAHKDGEREQSIKEHLEGTAERAGEFAEKFGKKEWGYCCGMLHDIGNIRKNFRERYRRIQMTGWIMLRQELKYVKNVEAIIPF